MNVVVLRGVLSRPAERRPLPSGSTLVAYEVTTRTDGEARTVPVVWPDAPPSGELPAGAEVVVTGAVRRRFFRTAAGTASRTEVVAERVVPAAQRRRVEAALQAAAARIALV